MMKVSQQKQLLRLQSSQLLHQAAEELQDRVALRHPVLNLVVLAAREVLKETVVLVEQARAAAAAASDLLKIKTNQALVFTRAFLILLLT